MDLSMLDHHIIENLENKTVNCSNSDLEHMTIGIYAQLRFQVYFVLVGLICCFGIVGNSLTVIVFQKDKQSITTGFLLQCLAVSDMVTLSCMFLHQTLPALYPYTGQLQGYYHISTYIIPYIWPLRLIANTCSLFIITIVTVDRYIRVVLSMTSSKWIKILKYTKAILVIAILLAIAINTPRFFALKSETVLDVCSGEYIPYTNLTKFYVNYKLLLYTIDVFIYLIPFITMLIFNTKLCISVYRANKQRTKETRSNNITRSITIVLISVVMVFLICETPIRVYRVLLLNLAQVEKDTFLLTSESGYYFQLASDALTTVNSSANFVIYSMVGQRFRKILKETFCRCGKRFRFKPIPSVSKTGITDNDSL